MQKAEAENIIGQFVSSLKKNDAQFKSFRKKFAEAKTENDKVKILAELATSDSELAALLPKQSEVGAESWTITVTVTVTVGPTAY